MDVEEILTDAYETLGKEDDIDPFTDGAFDLTNEGSQRMLKWLNRGYNLLLNFRTPDGAILDFPVQTKRMFFKTAILEGTATAGTASTITLDGDAGATADQYNEWLVSIEDGTGKGQYRMITDYTAARVATVHEDWDTNPDNTSEYMLYKRWMEFMNSGDTGVGDNIQLPEDDCLVHPLKIIHIDQKRALGKGGRFDAYSANILADGTPSEWVFYGDQVVFNYAPKEVIWYLLEYRRNAPLLTAASDVPEVPREWQEVLFSWMLWKGRLWMNESNVAYGAKKDFFDMLRGVRVPGEGIEDREEVGFEVDLEG